MDFTEDIKWIYEKMELDLPTIYVCKSYSEQKRLCRQHKSESLEHRYNEKIRNDGIYNLSQDAVLELRTKFGNSEPRLELDYIIDALLDYLDYPRTDDQFFGKIYEQFYSLNPEYEIKIKEFYDKGVFNVEYYEKECYICLDPVVLIVEKNPKFPEEGENFKMKIQFEGEEILEL